MITPRYRTDLDGLRGIAVLMAVMFHAFPTVLTGGYIGVEIFFVVSGFLIGTILLQSAADRTFTYREFYARRVRRIFPALVAMLATCVIAGWFLLLTAEYVPLGKHIVAGAGFVSNLAHWSEVSYFDTAAETKPLLHLWSLGVEEQFYIFLPPILLAVTRLRWNMRVAISVLWLLSYGFNLYLTSVDKTAAFYSPLPRLWQLLTGCMLASLFLNPPRWSAILRTLLRHVWVLDFIAVVGILLILVPTLILKRESYFPGAWTSLPVAGTAMLVAVGGHARFSRVVLSNPLLTWIGRISYPLYLWHWPLLSIAHLLAGQVPPPETRALLVAASVVLATLTYYGIEQPMRFGRLRRHAVPLVSALMLLVALSGAIVWQGDILRFRLMAQRETVLITSVLTNIQLDHKYPMSDCGSHPAIGALAAKTCRAIDLEREGPLLVLWGDSQLRTWGPVFAEIAHERGLRLVTFSHPGCPPLLNVRRGGFDCDRELMQDIAQSIAALHADQVVLISQWDLFAHGVTTTTTARSETFYLTDVEDGDADASTSLTAFSRQFPATVQRLRADGAQVLIVKAPPMLNQSSAAGFVRHPDAMEPTLAQHQKISAFTTQLIDEQARQRGVQAFDLAPQLCDATKCRASKDGVLLYSDDNHLTIMACLEFKPQLQALVIDPAHPAGPKP